jgi:methylenetetrahydrofolate reductase (NADPH)
MATRVPISFEFFPPRSERARETLEATVALLAPLEPLFMTVTYGAGGTTSAPTLDAVIRMSRTGIPIASHLTFVSTPIWEVARYAGQLRDAGIDHVVALRGDPPPGKPGDRYGGAGFFHSSPAFVASLKQAWGFDISVSAYPEKHPDAQSTEGDIEMLANKEDAGASRAITQFFFDNDIYYRFRDDAAAAGVAMPIVPGLLPIMDFTKMTGFAARCGASVPSWLHDKFSGVAEGDARKVAEEVLVAQAADLVANGVPQLHVFTLNEAAMTKAVFSAVGAPTTARYGEAAAG